MFSGCCASAGSHPPRLPVAAWPLAACLLVGCIAAIPERMGACLSSSKPAPAGESPQGAVHSAAKAVATPAEPPPAAIPVAQPAADPPRPMPFAIARNCHESLRGGLIDCKAALDAGDVHGFDQEWQDFHRAAANHAFIEDAPGGFFATIDARFDGAASKAGLSQAHARVHVSEEAVNMALSGGSDVRTLEAAFDHFAEQFEAHLVAEEGTMMPLTMKMGATPAERGQAANTVLLKTLLAQGDFDWALGWNVRKLVKHKPPTAVRVYVWGLQHACTPAEYEALLPVLKANIPAEVWAPMAAEFDLEGPGKVAAAACACCQPGAAQNE